MLELCHHHHICSCAHTNATHNLHCPQLTMKMTRTKTRTAALPKENVARTRGLVGFAIVCEQRSRSCRNLNCHLPPKVRPMLRAAKLNRDVNCHLTFAPCCVCKHVPWSVLNQPPPKVHPVLCAAKPESPPKVHPVLRAPAACCC